MCGKKQNDEKGERKKRSEEKVRQGGGRGAR